MRELLRRFCNDQRGNIAILAGLFLTVIIGFGALSIDIGKSFTERRRAQGSTDLAALAAVTDLNLAAKAASATIHRNNYPATTPVTVDLGVYTADASVAPSARFKVTGASGANAVRVTLQTSTPLHFGRALTGKDSFRIQTQAIATQSAFASFAIGSRLLKLDGGLLNAALGGMLGSNLSLSVMDYQSLADAKLDLFDFSNAVGTRARITGPTYDSILKSDVRAGAITQALEDSGKGAYSPTSSAVRALDKISDAVRGSSNKLPMGSLVDLGPYKTMTRGEKPKFGVSASALDMVTATAQLANGQNQVAVGLDVNIPGIAGAVMKLSIGERPVGTSWVTVGAAGASVHTAQTRLLLIVDVNGAGSIASVKLPIYLEIASATAKLNSVSCGFPDASTSTVTLGVTPAVIDAWIGDVSAADFVNFKRAPSPSAAQLISTPLLRVSGRAHATVTNMSATPVTFSNADISRQAKKTVGTSDFTASLLSRLFRDLSLDVAVLGLGIGLPGAVTAQVGNILANAARPIDQLLASVLSTVGVGLGQADVWVLGVRCDGAVLVN